MNKYISDLGHYLHVVFINFIILAAGVFGFFYWLASVSIKSFPAIEGRIIPYYLLGTLAVSSFHVWRKEKNEKEKLKHLMENPVDYKVTYILGKKFTFPKEEFYSADYDRNYAQDLIQSWPEWERSSLVEEYRKKFPSVADCERYLKGLEEYDRKVDEFEEKTRNCYLIDFYVKNAGSAFDERVTANIHPKDKAEDKKCKFYENIFKVCPLPKKPSLRPVDPSFQAQLDELMKPKRDTKRKYAFIVGNTLSVEFHDLFAKAVDQVIRDRCVIQTTEDKIDMKYEVTSKNAKDWVKGEFTIDLTKPGTE